jgi:hypothetical protein
MLSELKIKLSNKYTKRVRIKIMNIKNDKEIKQNSIF